MPQTRRQRLRAVTLACTVTLAVPLIGADPAAAQTGTTIPKTPAVAKVAADVKAATSSGQSANVLVVYKNESIVTTARANAATAMAQARQADRQKKGKKTDEVAIQTAGKQAFTSTTKAGFAALKKNVSDRVGGIDVIKDYAGFPVSLVGVTPAKLGKLAADSDVLTITANHSHKVDGDDHLKLINQPAVVASGDDGSGTAVAVLDTGVDYTRAGFDGCFGPTCNVVEEGEFAPNDGKLDAHGHGSNVAGLALQVAPKAKIVAGDVFDGDLAWDSDVIAGLFWVTELASVYNIKAVNLSLGDGTHNQEECGDSVYSSVFPIMLWGVQVQPVVAAGNAAYVNGKYVNGVSSPACAYDALAVGAVYDGNFGGLAWSSCTDAVTKSDKIACWSQGGEMVGVLAPGSFENAAGVTMSGTSMATPHAAGAIAALASGAPAMPTYLVSYVIEETGKPIKDGRSKTTTPRLDMKAAQAALLRSGVVQSGNIGLGINQSGELTSPNQGPDPFGNTTYGLRYLPTGHDLISLWARAEGWSVGDASTGLTGGANQAYGGPIGIKPVAFIRTPTTAKSMVMVGTLQVTHYFHPSSSPNLYQVDITIKNNAPTPAGDVRYRRTVDWDVEPTPFDEYVSINKGSSSKVLFASDNGFAYPDPLVDAGSINFSGNGDRVGPSDHGANFDFGLGSIAPNASVSFTMYYGAAGSRADAIAALKTVRAEAYALGEPNADGPFGTPNTAIMAFTRIGGKAIRF